LVCCARGIGIGIGSVAGGERLACALCHRNTPKKKSQRAGINTVLAVNNIKSGDDGLSIT